MNYIDVILLILLLLSMLSGYRNGFVEELAGLAALILGIWVALRFSGFVVRLVYEYLGFEGSYLSVIVFIAIFLIIVILVNMTGAMVSNLIKAASLGFVNRLAGLFFGVIKGALILSVLLVVINKFDKDLQFISPDARAGSRMYEPVRNFAPSVFPFLDFWGEHQEEPQGERMK